MTPSRPKHLLQSWLCGDLEQYNAGLQSEIAARVEAERALKEAYEAAGRKNAELEKANRLKTQFLATMSHELKTPLNAIIGFSEMLRDGLDGEVSPRQKDHLDEICQAGSQLSALVDDLLDLSHIEAGRFALAPEDCDLALLLDESVARQRAAMTAKHLAFAAEIAPALGNLWLDPRRLSQILAKLLANAVKFTPEGGAVSLRARRTVRPALPQTPGQEAAEYLELSVADNGPGIAPELRERLFEPFALLNGSLTRAQGGTGLGLALVWRLAALMGGTVAVESAPGTGARFTLWLPWHSPLPPFGEERGGMDKAAPAVPLALVVEDDDLAAELIRAQLAAEGIEVLRARSAEEALRLVLSAPGGAEGLALARAERPDLILLDLMMPEIPGFEVVERLKEDPATAAIPVLIVTAKILTDEDRRSLDGHVLRVMEKAEFNHGRFINEVRRALRRRITDTAPCPTDAPPPAAS